MSRDCLSSESNVCKETSFPCFSLFTYSQFNVSCFERECVGDKGRNEEGTVNQYNNVHVCTNSILIGLYRIEDVYGVCLEAYTKTGKTDAASILQCYVRKILAFPVTNSLQTGQ